METIIEEKYLQAAKGIKEEWLQKANSCWYDYITGLPADLRIAYLIVVFHNQIFNGGFHQYFVNGYGQFSKETIAALIKIGALKKSQILRKAFDIVNETQHADSVFQEKLLKKEVYSLFVGDELFEPLDNLDAVYYAIEDEKIHDLLSNYLSD